MACAPASFQRIPLPLSRCFSTDLHALLMMPEPMGHGDARVRSVCESVSLDS